MNGDPVASLNGALEQLEASRRSALASLTTAAAAVEQASKGRSTSVARDLKAAAHKIGVAAQRIGAQQFHGTYKGTNASFLGSAERRLLSGIAIGAAALLASWVFLIATLAAAQLEPGQSLSLGGIWILVGLVGGFLAISVMLAYGFRSVHVTLRSVDGEVAEVERSEDLRARRRLERQVAQATRESDRATKRAEKAEAEAAAARAEARSADTMAREAAATRDAALAAADANGSVEARRARAIVAGGAKPAG